MPRPKKFGENVLKDGVVAGFRLNKVKQYPADLPFNNPSTGMIEQVTHTKLVLPFTLEASTIRLSDYATENPDPNKPLQLEFHTFIRDGVPLDKAPQDDMDRLNFITYSAIQDILNRACYDGDKDDAGTLKWPLPGLNYIMVTLREGATRNFASLKDGKPLIGGEDLVQEIRESRKQLAGTLKGILSIKRPEASETTATGSISNLLNLGKAPVTSEPTDDPGPTEEEMQERAVMDAGGLVKHPKKGK